MRVRGWLLVGTAAHCASSLPPERDCGFWTVVPDASRHEPGDWLRCDMSHGSAPAVVLVCVDLPVPVA